MPEVLRQIASRLRVFVGNRRSATRHRARLPLSVSLVGAKSKPETERRATLTLAGHTLDISATGLALVVPAIRIGGQYLTGEGHALLIQLELPDAPVMLRAVAVRYERLEQDGSGMGYMIGARITEMSAEERARFDAYLENRKERR